MSCTFHEKVVRIWQLFLRKLFCSVLSEIQPFHPYNTLFSPFWTMLRFQWVPLWAPHKWILFYYSVVPNISVLTISIHKELYIWCWLFHDCLHILSPTSPCSRFTSYLLTKNSVREVSGQQQGPVNDLHFPWTMLSTIPHQHSASQLEICSIYLPVTALFRSALLLLGCPWCQLICLLHILSPFGNIINGQNSPLPCLEMGAPLTDGTELYML